MQFLIALLPFVIVGLVALGIMLIIAPGKSP